MNSCAKCALGGLAALLLATGCAVDPDYSATWGADYGAGIEGIDGQSRSRTEPVESGPAALQVIRHELLGDVVADRNGYMLYLTTADTPPESNCVGECARTWPPLLGTGQEPVDGVPAGMVGSTEREDGERQLTFNDWPLYNYVGDPFPGDINGQGVGRSWYAISPDGVMVRATAGNPDWEGADETIGWDETVEEHDALGTDHGSSGSGNDSGDG